MTPGRPRHHTPRPKVQRVVCITLDRHADAVKQESGVSWLSGYLHVTPSSVCSLGLGGGDCRGHARRVPLMDFVTADGRGDVQYYVASSSDDEIVASALRLQTEVRPDPPCSPSLPFPLSLSQSLRFGLRAELEEGSRSFMVSRLHDTVVAKSSHHQRMARVLPRQFACSLTIPRKTWHRDPNADRWPTGNKLMSLRGRAPSFLAPLASVSFTDPSSLSRPRIVARSPMRSLRSRPFWPRPSRAPPRIRAGLAHWPPGTRSPRRSRFC